jgi:hypothetical protein
MTKRKKPKKQHVGPSKEVDRRIRGVGRIRHASGLPDGPQFRALNTAITEASKTDEGRAILRMMVGKHPKLRADVFFRAANTKTLHLIPQGNAALPLVDAVTQWREDTKPDVSTDTYPSELWRPWTLQGPSVSQKVYAKAFRAAADAVGLPCTPYDLRRSFANWMEAAGIPRTRRKLYLGHGAADVTDLYERHEVQAFLLEDGRKLRAWIDRQLAPKSPVSPETSPDVIL